MFTKLKSLLGISPATTTDTGSAESVNCRQIVKNIREQGPQEVPVGQKIYDFSFEQFTITLDREFTGHYRISVFQNHHKVYGFTVNDKQISDKDFVTVWEIIIQFLGNDPSPKQLPEHKLIKAHFFGPPKTF
ncbi:MAG: hypothetical protein U5J63_09030 [Fodinibius sp.]|nr:hypothetical protein [Fodinibius sp.]